MGLDYVEYLMELEKVFEIEIPDEDATSFVTIGDAELYLIKMKPSMAPDSVRDLHREIIAKILFLELDKISNLKPTDRYIEDLRFD